MVNTHAKNEKGVQLVKLMRKKAAKYKFFSPTANVHGAAAKLECLQTNHIWQVMRASLPSDFVRKKCAHLGEHPGYFML